MGVTPRIGQKGLWALGGLTVSTVVGHSTGHKTVCQEVGRGCGQTGGRGAYVHQHLSFSSAWEGPRKKGQGFQPDLGKPAVRDYRGATGNVSHGGNENPSCNRKSRNGNPPPKAGAPVFYPNGAADKAEDLTG